MSRRKRKKLRNTRSQNLPKTHSVDSGREAAEADERMAANNVRTKPKRGLQRWESWLGIAAAIATVLAFVFDFPQKCGGMMTPASSRFAGVVKDESGQYLAGASIEVKDASHFVKVLGSGQTLSSGEFNIIVQSKPEETVWVKVSKAGYSDFAGMQILTGNAVIILKKLEGDLP